MGYEDDELKPYVEPPKDARDERRILKLQAFGYNIQQVHEALDNERFEEIHATYLLLKEKKLNADNEAAAALAAATASISATITANTSNNGLEANEIIQSHKTLTNDSSQVYINI